MNFIDPDFSQYVWFLGPFMILAFIADLIWMAKERRQKKGIMKKYK